MATHYNEPMSYSSPLFPAPVLSLSESTFSPLDLGLHLDLGQQEELDIVTYSPVVMSRSGASSFYETEDLEQGPPVSTATTTNPKHQKRTSWNSARPDSLTRADSVPTPVQQNFSRLSMALSSAASIETTWPRPATAPRWSIDEATRPHQSTLGYQSEKQSFEQPQLISELPDTAVKRPRTDIGKAVTSRHNPGHRRLGTPLGASRNRNGSLKRNGSAGGSGTGATTPKDMHSPPSVRFDTPLSATPKKSQRSMDVMHAASRLPWHGEPEPSTKSLLSQNHGGIGNFVPPAEKSSASLPPSAFAQQVYAAGREELLIYEQVKGSKRDASRHGQKNVMREEATLDLATLQRMAQYALQRKLVEQVRTVNEHGGWMEIGIRETLHQYCETVRDLELMEEHGARRKSGNDPFLLSTKNALQAQLLEDASLVAESIDFRPVGSATTLFTKKGRSKSAAVAWLRRLLMAFTGGLALIGPFLIMLFFSGTLARIVTTCGFMAIVAIALSAGSEMGPDRVGTLTAAYAGILIVFVGTNPPSYFPA